MRPAWRARERAILRPVPPSPPSPPLASHGVLFHPVFQNPAARGSAKRQASERAREKQRQRQRQKATRRGTASPRRGAAGDITYYIQARKHASQPASKQAGGQFHAPAPADCLPALCLPCPLRTYMSVLFRRRASLPSTYYLLCNTSCVCACVPLSACLPACSPRSNITSSPLCSRRAEAAHERSFPPLRPLLLQPASSKQRQQQHSTATACFPTRRPPHSGGRRQQKQRNASKQAAAEATPYSVHILRAPHTYSVHTSKQPCCPRASTHGSSPPTAATASLSDSKSLALPSASPPSKPARHSPSHDSLQFAADPPRLAAQTPATPETGHRRRCCPLSGGLSAHRTTATRCWPSPLPVRPSPHLSCHQSPSLARRRRFQPPCLPPPPAREGIDG